MTSIVSRGGILLWALAALFGGVSLHAQKAEVILERDGSTIVLEPYAPNIVRVTLSKVKDKATAAPGYGFVGSPSAAGWKHEQDSRGDIYTSTRLVVVVAASQPPKPTANDLQLAKFFDFFTEPRAHITISTPEGKTLLDMLDWKHGDTERQAPIG